MSDVGHLLFDVRRPMSVRPLMLTVWCQMTDVSCQTSHIRRLFSDVHQMSDICCLMSDLMSVVWWQMSDVRRLMFIVGCRKSDVRCLMFISNVDIWCLLSDGRQLMSYVRCLTSNVRRLFSDVHQTSDVCCLITDVRCLMFVVRFQTSGVWRLLFDVRRLMLIVWCLLADA